MGDKSEGGWAGEIRFSPSEGAALLALCATQRRATGGRCHQVFWAIASNSGAWAQSAEQIGASVGCSKAQVYRCLTLLAGAGIITVRGGTHRGRTCAPTYARPLEGLVVVCPVKQRPVVSPVVVVSPVKQRGVPSSFARPNSDASLHCVPTTNHQPPSPQPKTEQAAPVGRFGGVVERMEERAGRHNQPHSAAPTTETATTPKAEAQTATAPATTATAPATTATAAGRDAPEAIPAELEGLRGVPLEQLTKALREKWITGDEVRRRTKGATMPTALCAFLLRECFAAPDVAAALRLAFGSTKSTTAPLSGGKRYGAFDEQAKEQARSLEEEGGAVACPKHLKEMRGGWRKKVTT